MNQSDFESTWTPEARKARFDSIVEHLSTGGDVMICTYAKAIQFQPKHVKMFKVNNSGLYMQRGKKWDCIDGAAIRFSVNKRTLT